MAEDEAKKLLDSKIEKKNWLIPALALKLPHFLNPLSKKEQPSDEKSLLSEQKSMIVIAEPQSSDKKPTSNFIRNERRDNTFNPSSRFLKKMNTSQINMELQQHFNRISSNTKNTHDFNQKFPTRHKKRRDSYSFKKTSEIDESPTLKHRRKLSFKAVDHNSRIEFLHKLKPKNEDDPKKNVGFKLVVSKIEQMLKNELENQNKVDENKKEENNEDLVTNIRKLGPWDEIWEDKAEMIKKTSIYGHFPSYKLRSLIVKGGDDLRQEILAMQLIIKFKQIFEKANIRLYLRPYEIIVTSANSGILGDFS